MEQQKVRDGGGQIPPGWRKLSPEQKRLTLRVLTRPEFEIWHTPRGLAFRGPGLRGAS